MEDNNTTTILDDGQYMDPLYYIALSSPAKLQKVVYDFGGKPANSKEELYAMAAAMRAAPSGGKKFMTAVFGNAHPDTDDILAAIKQPGKTGGCGCDGCKKRKSSSYEGCGCSSYSDLISFANSTDAFEKQWCGLDIGLLRNKLKEKINDRNNYSLSEDVQNEGIINRLNLEIDAIKKCILFKELSFPNPLGGHSPLKNNNSKTTWLDKIPTWAKITGAIGTASLLTFGMIKIAQSASK